MAIVTQRRFVNPRLGTYFGVFASTLAALVLLTLILEQLGAPAVVLRSAMLLGPIVLYSGFGIVATSREPIDFFAAGRRVPSVYTGLVLAGSALGATGTAAVTGLFFINGSDAWSVAIGVWAGFVAMALLLAPYLRKLGAYTMPSYLGRRLESSTVRLAAAALMTVPTLLVAAAELKMGAFAAAWLAGLPQAAAAALLAAVVALTVAGGGARSLTWSGTAQAIAALAALLVPVAIVATLEINLPLPQLSHGPVLRGIGRLEAMQGVPTPIASALALEFAGDGLEAITHRIAQPYASIGPVAFILLSLGLMCGVAAAPWLLPRCVSTPGVYETRKASAWAIVFSGLTLITAASIAVFLRDNMMDHLVGRTAAQLPDWFAPLKAMGFVDFDPSTAALQVTSFLFKRDTVIGLLPIAAGFVTVAHQLALVGIIAAALLGAGSAVVAIGTILAEDGFSAFAQEVPEPALRLGLSRAGIVAAAVVASWMAMLIPADPLDLMLWALAITASSSFPVLVLSIWWKRLTAFGALVGMATGFGVAVLSILVGEATWLGLPGPLAATLGMPAGFIGAVIGTRMSPAPGRHVLQLVQEIRLPGGETIADREARLQRLKQRRAG